MFFSSHIYLNCLQGVKESKPLQNFTINIHELFDWGLRVVATRNLRPMIIIRGNVITSSDHKTRKLTEKLRQNFMRPYAHYRDLSALRRFALRGPNGGHSQETARRVVEFFTCRDTFLRICRNVDQLPWNHLPYIFPVD